VTWWLWTILWIALVTGAAGVLFVVVRSLWRKGMALARELGEAGERLSAIAGELPDRAEAGPAPEELAVFRDPAQLRAERIAAGRGGSRQSIPVRPAGAAARSHAGDRSGSQAQLGGRGT
jgi:hypothetical protein